MLFPNVALTGRLPAASADQITSDLATLAPLFQQNAKVVGASFAQLTTKGLSTDQTTTLQTAQARMAQVDRAYPGLGLAAVLDDATTDATTKAATVTRRVLLVGQVSANLGATPVLRLDLSANSTDLSKLGLDKLGATADEQGMVTAVFQTYQRAWTVAKNIDDAQTLVAAGFTSGRQIATLPLQTFAAQTRLDLLQAKGIHDQARSTLAHSSLLTAGILDVIRILKLRSPYTNLPGTAGEYLAQLPGFQQMFGSLSFCACAECRSILGPAAYFVDLMKYIEESLQVSDGTNVTALKTYFDANPGQPLDLKTRRPDLWSLELSCDNTNDTIATLDIVNEVLENYIAQRVGYAGNIDDAAADRAAIDTSVYEQTLAVPGGFAAGPTQQTGDFDIGKAVYEQTLTQVVQSFRQPFYLPIARIASYLPALGSAWPAVAEAVGATAAERAQAELGISAPELAILTEPVAILADLDRLYGLSFVASAPGSAVLAAIDPTTSQAGPIDASTVYPPMGLTRAQLGQLVATSFVGAGGSSVTILATMKNPPSPADSSPVEQQCPERHRVRERAHGRCARSHAPLHAPRRPDRLGHPGSRSRPDGARSDPRSASRRTSRPSRCSTAGSAASASRSAICARSPAPSPVRRRRRRRPSTSSSTRRSTWRRAACSPRPRRRPWPR